jgi:hypothetical protein
LSISAAPKAYSVDEFAVISQAHVGFLGHGVGRINSQTPAQLVFGGALVEDFGDRRAGFADPRHVGRVHAAQGAGDAVIVVTLLEIIS